MYCLLRPCYWMSFRLISKIKLKHIIIVVSFVMLLDYFGAFTHLFEVVYDENFSYPYDGDIHEYVSALRHNQKPAVDPINEYNYSFIFNNEEKCTITGSNKFRVLYLVKSAIQNVDRRTAIRNSWGFEKRFSDVSSRTVFLLGVHPEDEELQVKIKLEAFKHKDIIQANFVDSYYNNTIKTMLGFKWAVKYCSNAKFYMFVDDDMYVSVKNVLRFIRNPVNYPDYLKELNKIDIHKREVKLNFEETAITLINNGSNNRIGNSISYAYDQNNETKLLEKVYEILKNTTKKRNQKTELSEQNYKQSTTNIIRTKRQVFDVELPSDVKLFAGFVFVSSPHRHKSSKWYVSLEEYPYHLWPPYVTAGAYIVSHEALLDLYYTSFYTKHFRFDDIFLGLVAKKADIEPFHCEEFHFYKKDYTKVSYKYVISSHGYSDSNELLQIWNEQKSLGNA